MNRRSIIVPVVAVATIMAAAVTIPAIAGTTDNAPTGPGGLTATADVGAAPETLAAMQRDLKITPEQARARVKKEAWATRTDRSLRGSVGAGYAGAWLTPQADQLMVAVTDEASAARVRRMGAQPKVVARNAATLNAVKQKLDGGVRQAAASVAGSYVDVANNDVVLVARKGKEAAARAVASASGAPAEAVRVVASNEAPRPLFDVNGGDAYSINRAARCSVGFSVQGGFVTAGHCGRPGDTTQGFNDVEQGTVTASSFPEDDWGVVEVNNQWIPRAVVNTSNEGAVPVAGSQEAPVGASVCRTGSTTGTRCGVIQAKNATVNYAEGTVNGLIRTNVCAEPGDSGGSWISGDQAQGVTSGGSGDCRVGGVTFFQPITEILEVNNLTLVTTGDEGDQGGGEEALPPATACAAFEATVEGNANRAAQTQPAAGFFRAAAGTHTACLDGPDGADVDLALQRLNGDQWQTVAAATGTGVGAEESISFTGPAGVYRYRVAAKSGQGSYVLGVNTP